MSEKVENALNESRILVLVVQVLVGFAYQALFQPGFERLAHGAQVAHCAALGCLLATLALLLLPAAYHRVVEQGNVSRRFSHLISQATTPALFPFSLALGLETSVVCGRLLPPALCCVCGLLATLTALFFWYGLEALMLYAAKVPLKKEDSMSEASTPLADKIKFVLTEARVILPGAQALLGFQFAAMLTDSFDRLAPAAKYVHLSSLAMVALATILLMAPAAFHRIVERGEDTERLHAFASAMVLGALGLLAPGIAGEVVVVVQKTFADIHGAWLAGGITLLAFYGVWFGYTFWCRKRSQQKHRLLPPAVSSRL